MDNLTILKADLDHLIVMRARARRWGDMALVESLTRLIESTLATIHLLETLQEV